MKKILVTGASGQLGQCIRRLVDNYRGLEFTFTNSAELDMSLFGTVSAFFRENEFDFCINCAAYTNVEQAEKEQEQAFLINASAVKNLAETCNEYQCTLFHISTDYVFDGSSTVPYSEKDDPKPINVYGASKLLGEEHIRNHTDRYFIIRTSWLYSDIGHNFLNTIRNKAEEGETLRITTLQKGTPTNAHDLAGFILEIVASGNDQFGTYHFSNMGEATWYDFAAEILKYLPQSPDLIESNGFRTLAERPLYSVLSKEKAQKTFDIPILHWTESLENLLKDLP